MFGERVVKPGEGARTEGVGLGMQWLCISISGMDMAVSLEHVSEIVPYERVSEVPGTPSFVRGVLHLRGRVIPVVDLAVKLGRTPAPVSKRTCILMLELTLEGETLPAGIVMDGVATLLEVDRSQLRPPPKFGSAVSVRYLEGLLPTARGMLPLIDVGRVFGGDELSHVAAVIEHAPVDEP